MAHTQLPRCTSGLSLERRLYGVQETNGGLIVFVGGLPIFVDGFFVGAVGVSRGLE